MHVEYHMYSFIIYKSYEKANNKCKNSYKPIKQDMSSKFSYF